MPIYYPVKQKSNIPFSELVRFALLLMLFLSIAPAAWADIQVKPAGCSQDSSEAVAKARQLLSDQTGKPEAAAERAALLCLIDAVAALAERLEGLSKGTIPFDGTAYLPQGFMTSNPTAEEAN